MPLPWFVQRPTVDCRYQADIRFVLGASDTTSGKDGSAGRVKNVQSRRLGDAARPESQRARTSCIAFNTTRRGRRGNATCPSIV